MKKKWFAHGIEREDEKINVVCFPYAGGTASNFSVWKQYLDEQTSLYPVLYPGRERRMAEKMPEQCQTIVKGLVDENEEVFMKPFILFGHCTGSILAYETARYVKEKLDREPVCFFASGAFTPDVPLWKGGTKGYTDDDFIKMLVDTGRMQAGMDKIPNFKQYYLPILRSDYDLIGNYEFAGDYKMGCPIISFYGTEDTQIAKSDIEKWESYTTSTYEIEPLEGGHFFVEQNAEYVCRKINEQRIKVK